MTASWHIERTEQSKSDDILFCIARHPETQRLYLGSSDFQVFELEVAAEKPDRVPFTGEGHQSYVTALARGGEQLVSGSYDRRLIWWDPGTRQQVRAINAHEKWIRRVMATPDEQHVVSVADDMQCKVWNAASGELVASLTDHAPQTPHNYPSMLYAVAISADGRWLATGDRVGHVAIWDAASFEKAGELECPIMYTWDPEKRRHSIGGIRSLAFSPEGTQLAVGGIGTIGNIDHLGGPARLEVFNWQTGERLFESEDEEHKGIIEQIAWIPGTDLLLTAGGDHKGFLTLYDAGSGELVSQIGSDGHIHGFVLDESSTTIDTAGHNRIERWVLSHQKSATDSSEG